ncbi:hypothetical protein, partial [Staphylococcus aureus]
VVTNALRLKKMRLEPRRKDA